MICEDWKLDFLFLAETHDTDGAAISAQLATYGLAYSPVFRSLDGPTVGSDSSLHYAPNVGGSIAGIWRRRGRIRVECLSQCSLGAASWVLRCHDLKPVFVVGVYLPPVSSRRASWRDRIVAWSTQEVNRLRQRFRAVIELGDMNARLGDHGGRFTEDAYLPRHDLAGRKQLIAHLQHIGETLLLGSAVRRLAV